MPKRGAMILQVAGTVAVIFWIGLIVNSALDDRRRMEAAQSALPTARAWLASIPAYEHLQVDVGQTSDTGPGLWFTGSLPTPGDIERFDAEAEQRFGRSGFAVISTVLQN